MNTDTFRQRFNTKNGKSNKTFFTQSAISQFIDLSFPGEKKNSFLSFDFVSQAVMNLLVVTLCSSNQITTNRTQKLYRGNINRK